MLLFAVPGTCGDVSDCLAALPASSATTREVSQTEIVSADVRIDPIDLITALGQACAYRLVSHKPRPSYPPIHPRTTSAGWIRGAASSGSG